MAVDNTARGLAGKALSAGASLADGSVTYAKIQDVSATDKLLGRSTAGAGVVEEIALTAAGRALIDDADASAQRTTLGLGTIATQAASSVSITGGSITGITDITVADGGTGASTFTDGGVLIGNGTSAVQVTTAGTSGQVLTSNGAGVDPTFQTLAAGGGSMIYLSTVTASASSTADVETTFDSTYDAYVIVGTDVHFSGDNEQLLILLKVGGAYATSAYRYRAVYISDGGTAFNSYASTSAASIETNATIGNAKSANFVVHVFRPSGTAFAKMVKWDGAGMAASGSIAEFKGTAANDSTSALTGVRFKSTTLGGASTIYGTFRLYGIKNS